MITKWLPIILNEPIEVLDSTLKKHKDLDIPSFLEDLRIARFFSRRLPRTKKALQEKVFFLKENYPEFFI